MFLFNEIFKNMYTLEEHDFAADGSLIGCVDVREIAGKSVPHPV